MPRCAIAILLWSGACEDRGFREIGTGPTFEVGLHGTMSGAGSASPVDASVMESLAGSYNPQPGYPTPESGAWLAVRTVADPVTAVGGWRLIGQLFAAELAWSGDCGSPVPSATNPVVINVFPGDQQSNVSVLVPLSNGIATFEADATGQVDDDGTLTARGTWTLTSCAADLGTRRTGDGEVSVRWQLEPRTLVHYPTPRRRAF